MTPLIKSGQEHVLSPINLSDVEVGDTTLVLSNGRRTGIMLCPSLVRLLNLIKQQTIMITVMDLPILILTPMEQTLTFIDRGC
mgnify:CR=1 FL=1